jgi:hypothetical protein
MKRAVLIAVAAIVLALLSSGDGERQAVDASNPATVSAPLISCANVTGDEAGAVSGLDFFAVLGKFGATYPALNFSILYDLDANNAVTGADFFVTLGDFGQTCPLVDTQVAQATLAVLNMGNGVIDCTHSAMLAAGYTLPTAIDAPGQGVHYMNYSYWDGVFDVAHPEGLVCDNLGGRLVAQLYYVEGDPNEDGVGWGPYNPPPQNPPDDVNIDTFCQPQPPNTTSCSWDGDEGWHVHYNLCTIHIGQPNASIGITPSLAACEQAHCSPQPVPCGAVAGVDYTWAAIVGWMGHLWNHKLNPNQVPDSGGTNGRFADCSPDGAKWTAYNCPQ